MPAILVHGVPETARIWSGLVDHLDRDDVVLLELPGFGSPLPAGFEPTMQRYAAWLADELAGYDDIDLVTHDWGGLLALRVLADRPPEVRSWVTDVGDLAADFRWHDFGLMWQRPGEGEALFDGIVASSVADRAALLVGIGVPEQGAIAMAEDIDATMASVLGPLYRSAADIGNEWGPGIDSIRGPGLVVESLHDPYRSAGRARRLAERTGSQVATLADEGHWWMLESPATVASVIRDFWSTI